MTCHRCPHCGRVLYLHDITDRQLVALVLLVLAVAVVTFGAVVAELMRPWGSRDDDGDTTGGS
jgi:hypothetical protein